MADAEKYAEEDRQRREEAEVRNRAETLAYTTEKFLAENADKVPDDIKSEVEAAIAELKKAAARAPTPRRSGRRSEHAAQVSQKMGTAIYAQSRRRRAPQAGERGAAAGRRTARTTTTSSRPRSSTTTAGRPRGWRRLMRSPDEDSHGPVIRDRRRIDPVTGQVRDAGRQGGQAQAGPATARSPAQAGQAARCRSLARPAPAGRQAPAGAPQRHDGPRQRRGRQPAAPGCGRTRRRPADRQASGSPSAPRTCSGCRPSTPTTASGSSGTGWRSGSRRWPTCSPNCCRCSTTSAGRGSTASCPAGSSRSPTRWRRSAASSG